MAFFFSRQTERKVCFASVIDHEGLLGGGGGGGGINHSDAIILVTAFSAKKSKLVPLFH